MFRWRRELAFVLLPWFSACIEAVTIGRECVVNLGLCEREDAPPPSAPLDASLDAQTRVSDASSYEEPDAGDAAGASADASTVDGALPSAALFPGLRNGSFEVTRGQPGALAFEPVDSVPLGGTLADPWAACFFGFSALAISESTRGSGTQDVRPTEGAVLVEADVGVTGLSGLRQRLSAPLQVGQRYGFRIDVRATPDAAIELELWGAYFDCARDTKLAQVPLPGDGWSSVCVSFEASRDFSQLMLLPVNRGVPGGSPRAFLDNLRADPSCR
jgi:hypothetical protein